MTFRRPSAATSIAFLALFAALTAPAWGASMSTLITGKQIANSAITAAKVKDGSLLRKDFKKGQLPAGPKGAKGDTGERAPPALPARQDLRVRRERLARKGSRASPARR